MISAETTLGERLASAASPAVQLPLWSLLLAAMLVSPAPALARDPWATWHREDYEEEAGGSFALLLNTEDNIYGVSLGIGTWLRGAPIFGDYFLGIFSNDIEDSSYSNVGMTIRLMPRWTFAPFAGAGGSYNYSMSGDDEEEDLFDSPGPDELPKRGESYWGGHVEAGFRMWTGGKWQLFELMYRQTWSSLSGDRDYWLVGISTGVGI